MNALELGTALLQAGVRSAVLDFGDGERYEFVAVSGDEFQLYREGDVPSNYIVEVRE